MSELIKEVTELAPYTTFKIGGPADYFLEANSVDDLIFGINTAQDLKVPYLVLGSGSNILICDEGFRGLVIRNRARNTHFEIKGFEEKDEKLGIKSRLEQLDEEKFYIFEELEVDRGEPVLIEVDSGWGLELLACALFDKNIVGLEPFAGIPGTVGGAIYGNSHGGSRYFGEYVVGATILTSEGKISKVGQDFFQFDYDYSCLKENGGVVLSTTLRLFRGDGKRARLFFDTWKEKKARQPKRSAGCIFQNLDGETEKSLGLPTNSVGYVLDQVLDLKGTRCGDAQVSDYHAAFIVNLGKARSVDVRALIDLCKEKAHNKLGLELKEEIVYVGFDQS